MYITKYILFENVKKAEKYLKDNGVNLEPMIHNGIEHNKKMIVFDYIKNLLKNSPNFIYNFTKYHFEEGVLIDSGEGDSHFYSSLTDFYNFYKSNKQWLKNYLPKDIIQYDRFEDLTDDIIKGQEQSAIDKFVKSLYPKFRNQLNLNDSVTRNIIVSFLKLDDEKKKEMSPLKYYKENNLRTSDILKDMEKLISNTGQNKTDVLNKIERYGDRIELVYDEEDILIIRSFDQKAICDLGSQAWCIVYNPDTHFSSYVSPLHGNTQFLVFDFSYMDSDPRSLYGITIDKNGEAVYGGTQDRQNNSVNLEALERSWDIAGKNLLTPTRYSDEVIKKYFSEDDIFKSKDYIHILDEDGIKNLSTTVKLGHFNKELRHLITDKELYELDTEHKYKDINNRPELNIDLKNYITEEEFKKLDIYVKMKYYKHDPNYDYKEKFFDWFDKDELMNQETRFKLEKYKIDFRKFITDKELYDMNPVTKLEYDNSSLNRKLNINLHNYITDEESKDLSIDKKIKNNFLLTDEEKATLTYLQRYKLHGTLHVEDFDEIKNLPLIERIKLIKEEIPISQMPNIVAEDWKIKGYDDSKFTLELDGDFYSNEYINQILELDDEHIDFIFGFENYEKDDEDQYVHHYMEEKTIKLVKEVMSLFDVEMKYDEHNNIEEGFIKKFFENHDVFYIADKFGEKNKKNEVTIESFMGDITGTEASEMETSKTQIEKILPYDLSYNLKEVGINIDIIIETLEKNPEFKTMDEVFENLPTMENILDEHNNELKEGKTEEEIKELDLLYMDDINPHMRSFDYSSDNKTFRNELEKSIEYLSGDEYDDIEENREYIDDILKKLEFKNNKIERNDVIIIIQDKKLLKKEVEILRVYKDNETESGWVHIDNLEMYLHKNLFESKRIKRFNQF